MSESTTIIEQVTLSAALPDRLVVNEKWPVTFRLHNASPEPVILWLRKDATRTNVYVEVRDAARQLLEPTSFGQRPNEHIEGAPIVGASTLLEHLEPGESHSWTLDLDRCFDFAPGEYTVEMSVPVEPIGRVRHEAHINVLPAAR